MAKGRILAIDDEPFFRQVYADLLTEEGYLVRTAADAAEALELLRREAFDLVITDMEMPGMNGIETTEAIRRLVPDQEVMVVTGQRDAAFAVEALRRGVSEYLLKPVNPDELLLVVGRLLFRQSQRLEHEKLAAQNVEIASLLDVYRSCVAFLQVQDIDRLGDLVLDTLMDLLRAEGAVLWLGNTVDQRYRLRCRRGLGRVTPAEESFAPGEDLRRLLLLGEPSLDGVGGRVWVPLRIGVEPLGLVRVEAPLGRSAFGPGDIKVAATAAQFAARTLHNLVQMRRLERDALRVPRGEAYTMAVYRDYATKELQRARRYGRRLAVVRLRLDNYGEFASRFRHREIEAFLARLTASVGGTLRDADLLAMNAPDDLRLLLPETDLWGSLVIQKRIRRALRDQLSICDLKKSYPVRISLRSAAFPGDGGTLEELERTVESRLERLRQSLIYRGRLEPLSFWATVSQLLGAGDLQADGDRLVVDERLSAFEERLCSRYWRLPVGRLDEILAALCREAAEAGRTRGIIYRGCDDFEAVRQALGDTDGLEKSSTSLYLLGGRQRVGWDCQHILPIHIADPNFARVSFLLYLNEGSAYALFARRVGDGLVGFHTADFFFVEQMIAKLQDQYQLQAQI